MKKRFILAIIPGLIFFSNSFAQSLKLDSTTQKYVMREVVQCDSTLTQQALFEKCRAWVVKSLKTADNNIQLDDKDFKQITSAGTIKTTMPTIICGTELCVVDFKLVLDIKPGKVRCTIQNIVHYGGGTATELEKWNLKMKLSQKVFEDIEKQLAALVAGFKASVAPPAGTKDEW